jgi:hypothetical protein
VNLVRISSPVLILSLSLSLSSCNSVRRTRIDWLDCPLCPSSTTSLTHKVHLESSRSIVHLSSIFHHFHSCKSVALSSTQQLIRLVELCSIFIRLTESAACHSSARSFVPLTYRRTFARTETRLSIVFRLLLLITTRLVLAFLAHILLLLLSLFGVACK